MYVDAPLLSLHAAVTYDLKDSGTEKEKLSAFFLIIFIFTDFKQNGENGRDLKCCQL